MRTLHLLAELKLEQVKAQLLKCEPDQLRKLQGVAEAWNDVLKMLDNAPASVDN